LQHDQHTEPERIRERYRPRDLRAFPLGREFILPLSIVERGAP